ncbi:MAG: AMP-binding protein [Actinomycetota bacterium]
MDVIHSLTLGDVLREHGRTRHSENALVCGEVRLTFAALNERVNRLANGLRGCGVGEGARVLWLGQNCHRALECLLAAAKLGAVFCPVNWRQSSEEIAFVIADAEPAVVIWQEDEIGATILRARELAGSSAVWLQHDSTGPGSYEEFLSVEAGDPPARVDSGLPLLQMYTAAFDGRPNGALLSHTAILVQDLILALIEDLSSETVYLASGPLFHIWTFVHATATFHLGGTIVVARRVDAPELCRLIDKERCTAGFIMEPSRSQMVEANREGTYDLTSFRSLPGSAEWNAMVTMDTSPWATRPGLYGQTEVAALVTTSALGGILLGRHGRTSPMGLMRIVGDDGQEVPDGQVGELVCRGPTVMLGYHNRPELNAQRQLDGWHHTNDLGRREADGSITFIGPKTTMIKSAAENIYPAEVEACILLHPAVREVCIIGVPDPKWTQSVKALIALRDGHSATADEIIDHCRTRIASYKKPRIVEFVTSLPRTPDGGVDRVGVDAAYGGGGYPGADAPPRS